MDKPSLIRTIYLYLFSLLGLALVTIGSVRFIDMALKVFVFTKAEEEQRIFHKQPPVPYRFLDIEKFQADKLQEKKLVTDEEKEVIKQWLADYKNWKETTSKINPVVSRRHKEASQNLAFIIVGLPLYLFHWLIIRRADGSRRRGEKSGQ